jgi:two-component system, NtrC family, response regulator AtoC
MSQPAKFKILFCGKKELVAHIREQFVRSDDTHLQFASSAKFLSGRVLFNPPEAVLVDADADGEQLQKAVHDFIQRFPAVPVFALARKVRHHTLVDLVKGGVSGFYLLPAENGALSRHIQELREEWRARKGKDHFVKFEQQNYDFSELIGQSRKWLDMLQHAKKIIANNARMVLIIGETGTGKELLARAIHYNSANRESPFVDISCSALPETLLESELFGHEKGAFTDARDRKIGLFELAGEGSIFLDEIGDISLAVQSKLLKVIENRTMRRIGGLTDIPVQARIIAATSADLKARMKAGEFRRDLFHRLNILALHLPPLRDRKDDIEPLANHFITRFNTIYRKNIAGVSPEALQLLMEVNWEGNVRELKHAVERAVLLTEHEVLDETVFEPPRHQEEGHEEGSAERRTEKSLINLSVPLVQASLRHVQRQLATTILKRVGGNKSRAAQILQISRPRLDRILSEEDSE